MMYYVTCLRAKRFNYAIFSDSWAPVDRFLMERVHNIWWMRGYVQLHTDQPTRVKLKLIML
jgi:hypothetical protein